MVSSVRTTSLLRGFLHGRGSGCGQQGNEGGYVVVDLDDLMMNRSTAASSDNEFKLSGTKLETQTSLTRTTSTASTSTSSAVATTASNTTCSDKGNKDCMEHTSRQVTCFVSLLALLLPLLFASEISMSTPPSSRRLLGLRSTATSSDVSELHQEFPLATKAECERFWKTYAGNNSRSRKGREEARERLRSYLEWRRMYRLLTDGNGADAKRDPRRKDREDWQFAWDQTWKRAALAANMGEDFFPSSAINSKKHNKHSGKAPLYTKTNIPQYIFAHHTSDILHLQLLPAQIDIAAASPEHHTLAVALYVNRQLSRHSFQTGNLWLDVRAARGWPNPTPLKMIPIIQALANHLPHLFPERLQQLIVFPVPQWAVYIFHIIRRLLPSVVQQRMTLVAGNESPSHPLPIDKMVQQDGASLELIQELEETRQQAVSQLQVSASDTQAEF